MIYIWRNCIEYFLNLFYFGFGYSKLKFMSYFIGSLIVCIFFDGLICRINFCCGKRYGGVKCGNVCEFLWFDMSWYNDDMF